MIPKRENDCRRHLHLLLLLDLCLHATSSSYVTGPYATKTSIFRDVDGFDSSDRTVDIHYPDVSDSSLPKTSFPLVSYLHGMGGGDFVEPVAYAFDRQALFPALASFGFVVAAPRACNVGCHDDKLSLRSDPPNFGNFYKQHFVNIEWVRNKTKSRAEDDDDVFTLVNLSAGVGIAGHSMGGQATVFASSYENASDYDIRAAVMHHAYTHEYPAPQIPFLAFTGVEDLTAPPAMAEAFFKAPGGARPAGLVNRKWTTHHEPDILGYNKLLPQFTAAWFKVVLEKTPVAFDIDFASMIFGNATTSLCGGGDGSMAECTIIKD